MKIICNLFLVLSYCVVILRVPPYRSVRVASCHLKLAGNSFHCQSCTTSDMTCELGIAFANDLKDFCVETSCQSNYQWAKPFWLGSLSNYDDDHNDDVKKTIGLMIKSTALHVHHAFYYISLTSTEQEGILNAHAWIRWTTVAWSHQIWRREIENSRVNLQSF